MDHYSGRDPPPPFLDAREDVACQPVGCGHRQQAQGSYCALLHLRFFGQAPRLGVAEHRQLQLLVEAHDLILLI